MRKTQNNPRQSVLPPGYRWNIEQGDCLDLLAKLPAESVDLVITDTAYESLEKHRARGTTTRLAHSKSSSNDWFSIFPNSKFPELFAQLYRVLRKHTHCYFFCDAETMFVAKPIAEAAGFKFWKPLVWDKQTIGMGYHYRARCEFILFFEKGKRKLNNLGVADVLPCKRLHKAPYPSQKPEAISTVLVEQSSRPNELVIDPFCGSGTVGASAISSSRRFWGCDISSKGVEVSSARLNNILHPSGSIYLTQVQKLETHLEQGRHGKAGSGQVV